MEEPFGRFGDFNPTGHAALYFSDICADSPTRLRACRPGELGAVVSRYHHVGGKDWMAIPLLPYLYAVEDLADVPVTATPKLEAELRDEYRRRHLLEVAPNAKNGEMPRGEWIQLIGASYDRQIYGFTLDTTPEQDQEIVARLNDSRNHSHFNLFFNNCADFSRNVLRALYPGAIHRNAAADFWLTTPKHLAWSVTKLGEKRPDLRFRVFQIPQVPGTIDRSHRVDGISESLVRSKKYLLPLVYLSPPVAGSLMAAYVGTGRFRAPKDAPLMPELTPVEPAIVLERNAIAVDTEIGEIKAPMACTPSTSRPVSEDWMTAGKRGE
jgi:hypothetical protein